MVSLAACLCVTSLLAGPTEPAPPKDEFLHVQVLTLDRLRQMANDEMAEAFVVDGGHPVALPEGLGGVPPEEPPPDTGRYLPAVPGPPYCGSRCAGFGRFSSQSSETDVHRAVHDAMRLAYGYYELRMSYPDKQTITSDSTLSLQIKEPASFRVAAEVYGENGIPKLLLTRK